MRAFPSINPLRALTPAILTFLTLGAHAQAPTLTVLDPAYTPTLTFDLATVRESAGVTGGGLRVGVVSPVHSTEFKVTNFTVKSLIQMAYGFGTPIANSPEWASTRYFNVEAKSDAEANAKMAKLSEDDARMEKQHMIQTLLAERMGLKFHLETRETSVYLLTLAKGGSKMKEIKVDAPDPNAQPDQPKPAPPNTDVKATGGQHGLEFQVQATTTKAIAAMLVSQIETPILDKTGLTGYYGFTLQFGRDWSAHDPDSWPDIMTAVQEQLGLKLESTKSPIPVLVIDHIDPPSAN